MTRTKIFLYPLLLLAFMALTACQQEQRTVPVDQDGERVSVSFSVDVPNSVSYTHRLDKIILNAEEVKARKPIHIEHYGPKSLTFVAWGNVAPADMASLELSLIHI